MPPSQLKRLKASLREQGLSNQQKSKKQKKQSASAKSTSERNNRAAALQQIRDSFNPFEHKSISSRPEKFSSTSISNCNNGAGGGYKAVLHRPGVSKSRGEEMRRGTLLPEMRRRNKVGGLVDRRIGEGDVDMTPEERAVQRFAREKERKAKGRGMFDLEGSDDEGGDLLTHGGRKVEDLVADDFQDESVEGSEDEEEELFTRKRRRESDEGEDEEGEEEVDGDEDDQPERKKTKKEVMHELIAKSKMHKYERQKVKEDDDDLREELDKGFGEILGLLQGVKKPPPPPKASEPAAVESNGPIVNPDRQKLLDGMERSQADKDYDVRMKQLATDTRAKPSDRAKTAEEKAADEAAKLQKLEEKRLKRMRGEELPDDEKGGKADKGDGVEDDGLDGGDQEEDYGDEAADFGFTSSAPPAKATKPNEQLVLDDEDEFALEDDLVASGSDAGLSDVESGEGSEDDSDLDMENHEDEEDEFVKGILGPEDGDRVESKGPEVSGANAVVPGTRLAFTHPCPRSHAELLDVVKDIPVDQLITVIQRIRALYHPSLSEANKESMADFSRSLVEHLAYMGNAKQPLAITEQVIRHLHSLSRTYPSEIGEGFRAQLKAFEDRGQPNAGDLIILTAIGSIYPTSDHWHQVVTPAITIMAKWLGLNVPSTTRIVEPTLLTTGAFLVSLCITYQRLSKRLIPEAVRFTLRALSTKSLTLALSTPHLTNLVLLADLYVPLSAFTELFTPFLSVLKSIPSAKPIHSRLKIALSASRLARRPLELHHHKPNPIRTSIPKFEESYNPDKHYDPDKERSDSKKLAAEYKRERKGAIRELRKDANFMAREMLREKKEADVAYEKKYRRLVAEVQGEAAQGGKEWEREKARNDRQKMEAKKKKKAGR